MRDINRIDKFLKELGDYWKKVPDWRFGQFICNVVSCDPFYMEEEDFIEMVKKFFEEARTNKDDK